MSPSGALERRRDSPGRRPAAIISGFVLPAIIADAGEQVGKRFVEFFTAAIRNGHIRRAYARAVGDFFAWCQRHGLSLAAIEPGARGARLKRHGLPVADGQKTTLRAARRLKNARF